MKPERSAEDESTGTPEKVYNPQIPDYKRGGIVIGKKAEGDSERIYYVGEDSHLLCIGATRSGKSRCLVIPSICSLGLAGESIVVSDPKAELYHYCSGFLRKLGYEVLVLDFKTPAKSQRYNLLQPIIDAIERDDTDRAEMLAWDLTNNLVGKPTGEKIWTNGECSIIAAAILCVVCDNRKRPELQNMTNVYWFISEMCKTIGGKMPILEYVKKLPNAHPARALLSISDVAPSRTRGSFYTSALTTLRLFTSKSIYAITHESDFSLSEVGTKKQALFIILPDEKTTFYPVISKEVSNVIDGARKGQEYRIKRLNGELLDKNGNISIFNCPQYKFLLDAPFKISDKCCYHIKKSPIYSYERRTGRKSIIGTMASESLLRLQKWLQYGCNAYDGQHPTSKPLSFWTEQDVLQYLRMTGIPYSPIYGDIVEFETKKGIRLKTTGVERSGCMYCMLGVQHDTEPNRFQKMQISHPEQYDFCINELGCGMVMDFLGVQYKNKTEVLCCEHN